MLQFCCKLLMCCILSFFKFWFLFFLWSFGGKLHNSLVSLDMSAIELAAEACLYLAQYLRRTIVSNALYI